MSKKHFEAIARTIRIEIETAEAMFEPIGARAMGELAKKLADQFGEFNPNFDRERFLAACGVSA